MYGSVDLCHSVVASSDILANAVTSGTVVIPHGLLDQGDYGDFEAFERRGTGNVATDSRVTLKVISRDATNVSVFWSVDTASALVRNFMVGVKCDLGM